MGQYYEFQAIDEPLTRRQVGELRAFSTRARITATSFVNYYDWGTLAVNPRTLVERYFDAHVYVAGAHVRELTLRFPRGLLDLRQVNQYRAGFSLVVRTLEEYVLLQFCAELDADTAEWDEGEGWLASLIPLRHEIANGDSRGLYLAWLRGVQVGEAKEDAVEPPVPPGLRELSGPLESLASFLGIDEDLIAVAARGCPNAAGPSRQALQDRIRSLPEKDKDGLLLRLATGDDPNLRAKLLKRLRGREHRASVRGRRTARQLLEAAEKLTGERHRREAQRAAKETARLEREQARERAEYFAQLAKRQPATWRDIEALIAKRNPKGYEDAVRLLADLRELAAQSNRTSTFETRLERLRAHHARKLAFIRRLDKARLGSE